MKAFTMGVYFLSFVFLSSAVHAQCGCSGAISVPYVTTGIVSPAVHSRATVTYVNRLTQPISRGTYTLLYAIHLSDGRVLLADFIPSGHIASGSELRSGGRKMLATKSGSGLVTVKDPQSNQVIATFDNEKH